MTDPIVLCNIPPVTHWGYDFADNHGRQWSHMRNVYTTQPEYCIQCGHEIPYGAWCYKRLDATDMLCANCGQPITMDDLWTAYKQHRSQHD